MKLSKLTVKQRLLLTNAIVNIIFMSLFSFVAYNGLKSHDHDKSEILANATDSILNKLDRNLFERYGDVQAFAVSEPARSGSQSRIVAFMNDMMPTYAPIYDIMIVTNLDGQVVAVNSVDKNGKEMDTSSLYKKNYKDTPWFQAAVTGQIKPATAFVEDVHIDSDVAAVTGGDGEVMNFTAPIVSKETGKILGVWTNRMSSADVVKAIINEETQKLVSEEMPALYPYLLDRAGKTLFAPKGHSFTFDIGLVKDAKTAMTRKISVKNPDFTGEAHEAFTTSAGYSIYPGQNWTMVMQTSVNDPSRNSQLMSFYCALAIVFLGSIFSFWVAGGITKRFKIISQELLAESNAVNTQSQTVQRTSMDLSQTSIEQASSLQETASSIEEMNSMTKKSAENARRSKELAQVGNDRALQGQRTVEEMVSAIAEIDESNSMILQQVEQSNQRITEIVKVITEIGNKTKVINDIVFQTKLLSFNASVEAARAGEHGKGFAVVAEEVGNLAQMSGNASKEISGMLEGSIAKVQDIVNETKQKVERLVNEGKSKVNRGVTVSKQCGDILSEIVKSVSEVNTMSDEISTAVQEQSIGISEITKAVSQLNEATQRTTSASQDGVTSAEHLKNQSEKLNSLVADLAAFAVGMNSNDTSGTSSEIHPKALHVTKKANSPKLAQVSSIKSGVAKASSTLSSSPRSSSDEGSSKQFLKVAGGEAVPLEDDPRFKDF